MDHPQLRREENTVFDSLRPHGSLDTIKRSALLLHFDGVIREQEMLAVMVGDLLQGPSSPQSSFRFLKFSSRRIRVRGGEPAGPHCGGTLCALSTAKYGESWAAGSKDRNRSSTKVDGFGPSTPSARPTMRRLFRLLLFSVSSARYSRVFTFVCRVWIAVVCSPHPPCGQPTALQPQADHGP